MQKSIITVKHYANAIILNCHYYLSSHCVLEPWHSLLWGPPNQHCSTLGRQMGQGYRSLEVVIKESEKRLGFVFTLNENYAN